MPTKLLQHLDEYIYTMPKFQIEFENPNLGAKLIEKDNAVFFVNLSRYLYVANAFNWLRRGCEFIDI